MNINDLHCSTLFYTIFNFSIIVVARQYIFWAEEQCGRLAIKYFNLKMLTRNSTIFKTQWLNEYFVIVKTKTWSKQIFGLIKYDFLWLPQLCYKKNIFSSLLIDFPHNIVIQPKKLFCSYFQSFTMVKWQPPFQFSATKASQFSKW